MFPKQSCHLEQEKGIFYGMTLGSWPLSQRYQIRLPYWTITIRLQGSRSSYRSRSSRSRTHESPSSSSGAIRREDVARCLAADRSVTREGCRKRSISSPEGHHLYYHLVSFQFCTHPPRRPSYVCPASQDMTFYPLD